MRDAAPSVHKLEDINSYDSDPSSDTLNYRTSESNNMYDSSYVPDNMDSEDPRSNDIGLDFLDWTYYNRHDNRHRHR